MASTQRPITEVAADLRAAEEAVGQARRAPMVVSVSRGSCDYPVRAGELERHELAGLELPQSRELAEHHDFVFVTDEQLALLARSLDAARPGLGLAARLMRYCGLRSGEALAVESGDFRGSWSVLRAGRQVGCKPTVAVPLKARRPGATVTCRCRGI